MYYKILQLSAMNMLNRHGNGYEPLPTNSTYAPSNSYTPQPYTGRYRQSCDTVVVARDYLNILLLVMWDVTPDSILLFTWLTPLALKSAYISKINYRPIFCIYCAKFAIIISRRFLG